MKTSNIQNEEMEQAVQREQNNQEEREDPPDQGIMKIVKKIRDFVRRKFGTYIPSFIQSIGLSVGIEEFVRMVGEKVISLIDDEGATARGEKILSIIELTILGIGVIYPFLRSFVRWIGKKYHEYKEKKKN